MRQQFNINSLLLAVLMVLVGFSAVEAHRLIERLDNLAREVSTIHARQQMNERRIDKLERSRP